MNTPVEVMIVVGRALSKPIVVGAAPVHVAHVAWKQRGNPLLLRYCSSFSQNKVWSHIFSAP
jgi:hypothetical protein